MPFSNIISVIMRQPFNYPCFPGVLFTICPHNILSKLLAAFQHNHCRINEQRCERNESCRNNYYQSLERIMAEPGIEPAIPCSQVLYALTTELCGIGIQPLPNNKIFALTKLKAFADKKLNVT